MSYEQEILEILNVRGEVIGFNEFCSMRGNNRKFNPSPFSNAIKNLKKKGIVDTQKLENGKTKYSLLKPKLEKAWNKLTSELRKIETSSKNPELNQNEKLFLRSNWVRTAIYQYNSLLFYRLFSDLYEIKNEKIPFFTKLQKQLFEEISSKLQELGTDEKYAILRSAFPKEPGLLSLNEYRKISYQPTVKEIREKKRIELEEMEQTHKKTPYCIFCGKKTRTYNESQRHENKHMDNFEKNPFKSIKNFNGLYCMACGTKTGTKEDLENHRCSLKN